MALCSLRELSVNPSSDKDSAERLIPLNKPDMNIKS